MHTIPVGKPINKCCLNFKKSPLVTSLFRKQKQWPYGPYSSGLVHCHTGTHSLALLHNRQPTSLLPLLVRRLRVWGGGGVDGSLRGLFHTCGTLNTHAHGYTCVRRVTQTHVLSHTHTHTPICHSWNWDWWHIWPISATQRNIVCEWVCVCSQALTVAACIMGLQYRL